MPIRRVILSGFLLSLTCFAQSASPPTVSVSGGLQTGAALQPLVFTWTSPVPLQGAGWSSGESISIALEGPLNTLGVTPGEIVLGSVAAGSQGGFSTSLAIPYDGGATGPQVQIPRPGLYSLRATGTVSGTVTAAYRLQISPATYAAGAIAIDWSHERGTRPGVLPGPLSTYSPERSDPNWITVWDNRAVGVYGLITGIGSGGANQPARISYEEDPLSHYAHDVNAYLLPDPDYRWVVGTANYYSSGEDDSGIALGRIEVEWESLNNGSTTTYNTGQIGLPDWAVPTNGDRLYTVGRWVLDCGHPEIGDRTEMHPPRLVAVMRQRPAASSTMTAAAQVDLYVSGHGGGANHYPSGLDALLSQGGYGGGRLRDVLSASDQDLYYRPGPLPVLELPAINFLVQQLTGEILSAPIYSNAGPSAFPWGTPAPEQQPVNDMDYDFDVPLPPPPPGASTVSVEVITQPQHTTSVKEAITYSTVNGLPVTAHIHLPYNGADNGIYARTLKFSWNTAPPVHRFRVHLDHVVVDTMPGEWHLWSDVSGQWTYLPDVAPGLLQSTSGQSIPTPGDFDVYLRDTDTLHIVVQGYRAECIDQLFGTLFGQTSYGAGIQLLAKCGPINNDDLSGALLDLPPLPSSQGSYVVKADSEGQSGGGDFQVALTVADLDPVQTPSECQGRGALAPAISANSVVGAGLSTPRVTQLSPDGLISIFGQNFAPAGLFRSLTSADIPGGQLPSNLGCTCVAVNHRLAPLLFVSPGQINAQVPAQTSEGAASVQVIANCGSPVEKSSDPQQVNAQPAAPEFLYFPQTSGGHTLIAATDAVTGSLIGPPGLMPGATFTPAKPGEYVALYATGLGLTGPPLATGVIATGTAATVSPVSVTLNGTPLPASDILYAGAAPGYAGLYQVNIQIPPDTSDGDLPVALGIGGISTPAGAFLTVQH